MAMSPNPRSQDRSEERAGHQAARRPCFSVPSPIRQWDHMVLISLSSVCCLAVYSSSLHIFLKPTAKRLLSPPLH